MSLGLSEAERAELHRAVAAYLGARGLSETAAAFGREAGVAQSEEEKSAGTLPLLERKWMSILRLQRRVFELEAEVKTLRASAGSSAPPASTERALAPTASDLAREKPATTTGVRAAWCARGPAAWIGKGHGAGVTTVAAHATDSVAASGCEDGTIRLWDLDRKSMLAVLTNHVETVHWVAFGGDSKSLVSASADRTAKVWELTSTGAKVKRTLRGHEDAATCAVFAGPGLRRWVATASRDGGVRLFDAHSGASLHILRRPLGDADAWPRVLAVPETGNVVAVAGGRDFCLVCPIQDGRLDADAQIRVGPAPNSGGQLQAAAFAPAVRDELARVLALGARDGSLTVWQLATEPPVLLATLDAHAAWLRALAWHPLGRRLVSASDDRSIAVWDLDKNRAVARIQAAHSDFVAALAFHAPTGLLVSAGADRTVRLWDSPR